MASSEYYITNKAVSLDNIPNAETLLSAGRKQIEDSESWTKGKTFNVDGDDWKTSTETFSRAKGPNDGAGWHGRVSVHDKSIGTWDESWAGLGVNHSANEVEYIKDHAGAKLVKKLNEKQEIWTLHYKLPSPVSDRVFTVCLTIDFEKDESTGLRTGYVVSIPIDVTTDPELAKIEQPVTKGTYASAERIRELPEGGVNWRMITSSSPGGYIPVWLSERSIPGTIVTDVPAFVGWLYKKKDTKTTTTS